MRDDIRLVGRKGRHVEPRYVEYIRRLRPVLFYDFCNQPTKYDTGTRDLAYDLSGNGNHGIIKRVYGASVINEKFTSAFDTPVQLDHRYIYTTPAPVVTNPTGDITYTEGTDYTINYTAGQITVLSGGTIPDATACYIDYTYDNTGASWRYGCLDFDGVDDRINVSESKTLILDDSLSISLWFRGRENWTDIRFVDKGVFGANRGYIVAGGGTNGVRLFIGDGSVSTAVTISGLSTNTWHHVALTFDGKYLKLYMNGALKYTEWFTSSTTIENSTQDVYICSESDVGSFWNGNIDNLAIFAHALTATEIKTLYELTRWRYTD